MEYVYGMRLRGFAPGCQPMAGLVDWEDTVQTEYHTILVYERELTKEECAAYELDFLNECSQ